MVILNEYLTRRYSLTFTNKSLRFSFELIFDPNFGDPLKWVESGKEASNKLYYMYWLFGSEEDTENTSLCFLITLYTCIFKKVSLLFDFLTNCVAVPTRKEALYQAKLLLVL